jgi:beta-lactam-binding protein with PASTA domain
MSIINQGLNAVGKLVLLAVLLATFLASMAGVVYMSLAGNEIKVPELVGKDFVESEQELAALGLKIKRRADRPSAEKINTVLEQLPRAGETVKTGQLILVVVSKAGLDADTPKSLIEDIESDDTEKIEEMISDKPKKAKPSTNSNTAKKTADTKRDVIANTATKPEPDNSKPTGDEKPKPAEPTRSPDSPPTERNRNEPVKPAAKPSPRP